VDLEQEFVSDQLNWLSTVKSHRWHLHFL